MTISEAQSVLHCPDAYGGIYGEKYGQALEIAFKCMSASEEVTEKATPRKPIQPKELKRYGMGNEYNDFACPKCKRFIAFEPEGLRYMRERTISRCKHCGQVLSWEAQNDD